jgi:hypothetical protein
VSEPAADIPARDHATRSCAVRCASCGRWTETALQSGEPAAPALPAEVRCACGTATPMDFAGHVDAGGRLDGCPACDYHTLCIQKDVNARLGVLAVLVVFGGLLLGGVPLPWMFAILVPMALLDWLVLRLLVRRVLICYRCKAQFRGFPPGARCRPFDLATWEAHDAPPAG